MSSEEITKKKEKKSKSKKQAAEPVVEEVATEPQANDVSGAEEGTKDKKRKREPIGDELEIDVSLPEPPSKKALRKAKKAKTAPATNEDESAPIEDATTEDKPAKEEKERRTPHSIWIGNLPWTASKQDIRDFITTQAEIKDSQITRLHLPAPSAQAAKDTRGRPPFKNKGFAYIDFDTAETLFTVLQISETPFDLSGRKVLIKNAASFEGRPEDHGKAKEEGAVNQKPPSKRVFVGNLAFEMTKEDLEAHFGQCGPIEGIHMATFEDSGKCKGYAWITFGTLEAAEAAVKGFVFKEQVNSDGEEDIDMDADAIAEDGDSDEDTKSKSTYRKKKAKPRKWFVNRIFGREVKREYAEDASVRYKKRYGGKKNQGAGEWGPIVEVNGDGEQGAQQNTSSHDRRREQRRAQREPRKVDARTIAPGAALKNAQRASGAINSEGKKGIKVTFD